MANVNLKWTDSGALEPDEDDVSGNYLLARQVAHDYHSSAVQTYINAESAAQQAAAEAAKDEQQKLSEDKSKKQAEGKAAESEFADTMIQSLQTRSGELQPAHGEPAAPPLQPSHTTAQTKAKTGPETANLEAPMVDPTLAAAAGAGAVFKLSMSAGKALMPSLARALSAGVINTVTDLVYGTSAEVVGAASPELALPFNIAVGLLGGMAVEPAIERGIIKAATAAGKKLDPSAIAEQVQLMKSVLANEAGMVEVWHGSPHRFDKMDISKVGTGEGAQSFGYGLYFTDKKEIAKHYTNAGLGDSELLRIEYNGKNYIGDEISDAQLAAFKIWKDAESAAGEFKHNTGYYAKKFVDTYATEPGVSKIVKEMADGNFKSSYIKPENIYRAQLFPGKDPSEYTFLDWYEKPDNKVIDRVKLQANKQFPSDDNPIYKQIVKEFEQKPAQKWEAVFDKEEGLWFPADENQLYGQGFKTKKEAQRNIDSVKSAYELDAQTIYRKLSTILGSDKEASAFLKRAGIDGIRYPTESLSGKGKKSDAFNYVVFDDKDVRLVARESGGQVDDLTKQAVIEELNAEIGKHPVEDALRILKSQKGEVVLRQGDEIKTKFKAAYEDAKVKSGGSSVEIAVLRDNLGLSQAKMAALLRKASKAGDVVMALGEPAVSDDFVKGGMVDGNLLVRVDDSFFDNIDKYLTPAAKKQTLAQAQASASQAQAQAQAAQAGGGPKSGTPRPIDDFVGPAPPNKMQAKADKFLANTNPDITQEMAGNVRLWGADLEPKFLSNIETPEDIMRVIKGTDEAFQAEREVARRGTRSWAETEAAAKSLKIEDLLGRKMGQALNAEQVENARTLLASSSETLKGMAQIVRSGQANDLQKADFMRAFNTHYAIQMQLSGAAAEAGRALQIFRKVAQSDALRVGQIRDFMAASAANGVSPEKLADALATMTTPAQVSNFVKQQARATSYDMFLEAWINGLLSGPVTHAVNTTSNLLTAVWMIPERTLAAGLSRLHGGEIRGGEVAAQTFGLVEGFKDGLKLAWEAFKKGESSDLMGKIEQQQNRAITASNVAQLPVIKKIAPNALEAGGVAARAVDALGEAIRVPGRFLTAEDELFKAIGYRMELQAQAYRKAANEGLEGRAMAQRMRDIIADPQNLAPEVHLAAVDAARYQTFTKDLGPGGRAIQTAANKIPGAKLVVPFIRTPANIMKFAFERTPLAPLMKSVRNDIAAGGARRDMALARISMGSMAMGVVASYAAAGMITGGGPTDTALRSHLYNTGWQPYSIKVGDKYYSYGRLEPVGMMMGLAADAVEIMGELDEIESDKVATTIVAAISKNVMSKTWLRGLSEMVSAMDDPDRYGSKYVKNLAGTAVPTGVAQIERTLYPEISEAQDALDAIKARIPGYSKELPTRHNLWGEKITFNGALGPDIISPIFTSTEKDSPIDRELLRMRAPIRMPNRTQSFEGVSIKLDPYEYEEFMVRMNGMKLDSTGKTLKKSLNDLVTKDKDYKALKDDDQKERMIRAHIQEAVEKTRAEMLETNNTLRLLVDDEHRRQAAAR
jgi:hypothetical protein